MKPEGWVDRHNPVTYETVATLIERLNASKREMAAIYLGRVLFNGGRVEEPGWCVWHNGVFVNPFDAGYFFAGDFDQTQSTGRLLQPEEVLHIRYIGEHLNGSAPPEGVAVNLLAQELRNAGKEMGAILIEKAYWKDGRVDDWRTKTCPHGDWVIWHGGVYINPFKGDFFLADTLDEEKTAGRLLRTDEPLEVKHYGVS